MVTTQDIMFLMSVIYDERQLIKGKQNSYSPTDQYQTGVQYSTCIFEDERVIRKLGAMISNRRPNANASDNFK